MFFSVRNSEMLTENLVIYLLVKFGILEGGGGGELIPFMDNV